MIARLGRAAAFYVASYALFWLAADELARLLGELFADVVTEPTLWDKYVTDREEREKPDAT